LETQHILVAEDYPLFRKGMISPLETVPEFEVASEAATGEEAIARAAQLQRFVIAAPRNGCRNARKTIIL
jgi:two-component system, NarL family, nitrate/nitrite response regulator NarL